MDFNIVFLKILYIFLSSSVKFRFFSKTGSTILIVFSDKCCPFMNYTDIFTEPHYINSWKMIFIC